MHSLLEEMLDCEWMLKTNGFYKCTFCFLEKLADLYQSVTFRIDDYILMIIDDFVLMIYYFVNNLTLFLEYFLVFGC